MAAVLAERVANADVLTDPYELEALDVLECTQRPGPRPTVGDRVLERRRAAFEPDEDFTLRNPERIAIRDEGPADLSRREPARAVLKAGQHAKAHDDEGETTRLHGLAP